MSKLPQRCQCPWDRRPGAIIPTDSNNCCIECGGYILSRKDGTQGDSPDGPAKVNACPICHAEPRLGRADRNGKFVIFCNGEDPEHSLELEGRGKAAVVETWNACFPVKLGADQPSRDAGEGR